MDMTGAQTIRECRLGRDGWTRSFLMHCLNLVCPSPVGISATDRVGSGPGRLGFTLVETLVSVSILAVLMLIMVWITDEASRTVRYTSGKMEQFRAARTAFESMNRLLSQATLNTYWDYDDARNPSRYERRSELRFISGNMEQLGGTPPAGRRWPTHGVFFQAPLGFSDSSSGINTKGLVNLLNVCGFFVEFGSDAPDRPSILGGVELRYRYRLSQLIQPADSLNLYNYTSGIDAVSGKPRSQVYTGRDWFTDALHLADDKRPVRFVADNVIALVILPKLSRTDDPTETLLAPGYSYDSTQSKPNAEINPRNQLPPMLQITMVAIDEASAARLANGTAMPDLGLDSLFLTGGSGASKFKEDLKTLEQSLIDRKLNYRVFTSDVSIEGAKWSRDQEN